MTAPNNTCDRCRTTEEGIDWFAKAYRKMTMRLHGFDPGMLCGKCAGSETGKRIAAALRDD